jgi:uncharacterized protein
MEHPGDESQVGGHGSLRREQSEDPLLDLDVVLVDGVVSSDHLVRTRVVPRFENGDRPVELLEDEAGRFHDQALSLGELFVEGCPAGHVDQRTRRALAAVTARRHHARVRFKVIPADEGFYELFTKAATNNLHAATLLHELFVNYSDRDTIRERIRQAEHEGDEITHGIMKRINTTFVTPFDREDIHRLASGLDDVMDHMDAAADFVVLHNIAEPLAELAKQSDVLVRACEAALHTVERLRTFRNLEEHWVEINRLENEGDRIYRRMIAELFSGDYKAMDVLKHKDVIEEMESALDSLENVANTIESIVLKHA